ncbi:MAG: type II toxin-antitoxin system RelB family antitoxin [Thermomicrobiales bacterium]
MAETRTITITIDSDLDDELDHLAATTGQSKPDIARDALIEWLEDQEDVRDAEVIVAQNNPSYTLAEVKKNLDLDD